MDLIEFIEKAIQEDVADGDHTTLATIPAKATGSAVMYAKEAGILAGVSVAGTVFNMIDPNLDCKWQFSDGDVINKGNKVMWVNGSIHSILKAERLVLNIMQRMSGIATTTSLYVKEVEGTKAKVLDTRKTTPNFRYFEKMAVKIGGGENHRFGLYDMILIKDNHIDYAGGVRNAISATLKYLEKMKKPLKIEIEARTLEHVKEVLKIGGADRIMLDNFTPDGLKKAVELIDGRMETEASGGITLQNIRAYAETGVDFISVGALTHSYKSLDLSLKAVFD